VSSIAALVMLGVIGGGGSVLGRCLRCVLLSLLSVGWCGSVEMDARCLLRRFDCSLGEGIVLLFVVMASCVSGVCVFVVEAAYEPPEFGGISVVCDCVEKLFPSSLLFVLDIIRYFLVQCLYSVDDIRFGELVSDVVTLWGLKFFVQFFQVKSNLCPSLFLWFLWVK